MLDDLYLDSAVTLYERYKMTLYAILGFSIITAYLGWIYSSFWLGAITWLCLSVTLPSIIIGRKAEIKISKMNKKELNKMKEKAKSK